MINIQESSLALATKAKSCANFNFAGPPKASPRAVCNADQIQSSAWILMKLGITMKLDLETRPDREGDPKGSKRKQQQEL